MKKVILSCLFLVNFVTLFSQTYYQNTAGLQNTYTGSCMVNTCGGTFYDNGGPGGGGNGSAGNYSNGINNIYRTFCPSTPGTAVRITFDNTFSLESGYDYLYIINGAVQNDPVIATLTGTAGANQTYTATNPSGCLSFRFVSDGTQNRAGWQGTFSCVAMAGGPTGLTNADCINATGICDNNFSFSGLSTGPGLVSDACTGCTVSENYSNWYEFTIMSSGTLGFNLNTGNATDDYDFALYQSSSCGGTPVRCSYAATTGTTGMSASYADVSEDVNGNGWVSNINVTAGQHFYLLINEWSPNHSTFTLDWTGTAVVGTTPPRTMIAGVDYSNSTYTTCQNAPLTITDGGTLGTYTWWNAASGGTQLGSGSTYSPSTATVGSTTYYLQVVTTSGCTSARTPVQITVQAAPTMTSGTSASICSGNAVNFNLTSSLASTYSWTPVANGNVTGEIAGTGSAITNTLTSSTGNVENVVYSVVPTSTSGGCAGTAQSVTVTVNPRPTVNSVTSPTVCAGSTVPAINFSSTPAGSTYTWTNNNTSVGLAASGSSNISSYTAPAVGSPQTGTVTVTPTLSGCAGNTYTFTITINQSPTVTTLSNITTACAGAAVTVPNFTITPAGTASWTNNNTGIGLGASGTGNIGTFTAGSAGTGTITVNATSGSCSSTTPMTFAITVNALPVISSMSNVSACGGSNVVIPSFTVTPSGTPSWTNSNTATGLSSVSGTGNISNFTAASVSSTTTSTITVNATVSGCNATPQTFTISVEPTPVISTMANVSACSGATVPAINYTVSPSATVNWTNNNTANGVSGSGSGNIGSYTAPVVSAVTTGTITANATLGSCNAAPRTFNVTINPTPVISSMGNVTACGNSTVSVPSFTVTPSATATWTNNNTGTGLSSTSGSGNISGFTSANVGTTTTSTITVNSSISGCNATPQTFNIIINPTPTISSVSNVTACGGASVPGTNFIVNPGGTATWTNNNTATGINGSGSGNIAGYTAPSVTSTTIGTVTVNASLGSCNATPVPFTVTINPTPVISSMSNITACGNTAVSVPAFTVTPSTTASWTNNNTSTGLSSPSGTGNISGFTSANVTSSTTGTITVNASASGCNATPQSFNITIDPTPSIAAISNQTVCSGATINAVSFNTTPSSGVGINWTNSNTAIGLAASGTSNPINGFVAATVATQQQGVINATPSLGACTGPVRSYTITVNPNPAITSNGTVTPSNCGASTGSILGVTASGAPTLSYAWNGGSSQANPDISNIPAGSYNLVVTDGNGCTTNGAFSVGNPGAPGAPSLSINNPAICEGGSAILSINSPSGGTVYNWTGPTGSLGTGTSITVTNATAADAGNYTASATAAGCTGAQSAATTLTVNPNPVPAITPNPASFFCSDASIVISSSGSNPGGTATIPANGYQWTLNGSPISGATASTYTATQSGTYGLTITNSNGCSATTATSTTLTPYPEPSLSSGSATISNSNCTTPSGSVTGVTVSGGTAGYTYTWYNASSTVIATSTTSADLDSIAAGTYTLIVIDANGCNDTTTATINNLNAPGSPSISGTNQANCSGSAMNPITMTSTGGTITWYADPGLTSVVSTTNPYTPTTTTTHTLYVTETVSGCESASTQVVVTVNPTPAAPTAGGPFSYCTGQTVADLTATGGSGTLNWYSDAGLTNQVGTGSSFASGATSTSVFYVAETALGCTGAATPVTININSLPTINVTNMNIDSASCGGVSDGNITGVVVGGTPTFTYVWSNATGPVSSSTTTPNLANQPSGSYTLTVTDGNTCVSTLGPVVLSSTAVPANPVFATSSDTVYCTGDAVGTLTASASNGNVYWYSDAGLTTQIGAGNTLTPTGITSNTTIYIVANNSGCVSSPVPVSITFNPLPTVGGNSPSTCAGGQVTLNGTGAVSYSWDNGVSNGVSFTPISTLNYIVTGTDANGCVNTATVTVTVNNPPTVGATQGSTAATCSGGTVTLNGTGATSYSWNNGVVDGVPFTPAASGNYVVTGTDANGCTGTFTVAVTVNTPPTVSAGAAATDTIPCGSTSFVLPAATTNAASPSYAWTGPSVVSGGTTATPTVGSAGSYTVVVTDGVTGCTAQSSITIVSNLVIADFTQDVTSGFNPLTVNFTNTSVNATSYGWSFGDGSTSFATSPTHDFTAMGAYTVILTASLNGCLDTAMVTIIVNENSSITIPNIFSPNGDDLNDLLTVVSTGIEELNIDIFNRWGQKVYTITAPGQSWDGKLSNGSDAAEGTYFYLLRAVGYDKKEYEQQGPVMLVK
jgi:gliding motility-associated-like protein